MLQGIESNAMVEQRRSGVFFARSSSYSSSSSSKLLRSVSQKLLRRGDSRKKQNAEAGCFDAWKFIRSSSLKHAESSNEPPSSSICAISAPAGCFGASRRNFKEQIPEEPVQESQLHLPDDIVEAILASSDFPTMVRARAVCKRWREMTLSPHFFHLRRLRRQVPEPWLLLLGLSRDGSCDGRIQALDPAAGQWRSMTAPVGALEGRLLFSAASFGSKVYIVGGCSAAASTAAPKTHRSVVELDLATGRWRKPSPMRTARTAAIVVAFEIVDRDRFFDRPIASRKQTTRETKVYSGGDRYARIMSAMGSGGAAEEYAPEAAHSAATNVDYGLLVIGGQGEWNEPLRSGEIYDPAGDTWREMDAWPQGMGNLCAGAVCGGCFYGYSDTDKLAAYDICGSRVWRTVAVSFIPPRLHDFLPKLVACNGCLFLVAVAWGQQARATRKLWRLDRRQNQKQYPQAAHHQQHQVQVQQEQVQVQQQVLHRWVEICEHPDAPLDWSAVFVGDGRKVYGVEMFRMFGQVIDFVTAADLSAEKARWDRLSGDRVAHDVDASSCLTKTAVVVHL